EPSEDAHLLLRSRLSMVILAILPEKCPPLPQNQVVDPRHNFVTVPTSCGDLSAMKRQVEPGLLFSFVDFWAPKFEAERHARRGPRPPTKLQRLGWWRVML